MAHCETLPLSQKYGNIIFIKKVWTTQHFTSHFEENRLNSAVQIQIAVTSHLRSEQLLLFDFARQVWLFLEQPFDNIGFRTRCTVHLCIGRDWKLPQLHVPRNHCLYTDELFSWSEQFLLCSFRHNRYRLPGRLVTIHIRATSGVTFLYLSRFTSLCWKSVLHGASIGSRAPRCLCVGAPYLHADKLGKGQVCSAIIICPSD